MTSVVQIVTKRASPTGAPEASGSFEAGSFGTFRGNAGVYGGAGGQDRLPRGRHRPQDGWRVLGHPRRKTIGA